MAERRLRGKWRAWKGIVLFIGPSNRVTEATLAVQKMTRSKSFGKWDRHSLPTNGFATRGSQKSKTFFKITTISWTTPWTKGQLIGKQKNKPNSCSSKKSSKANRAVWTKNHPRKDSTWTNTPLKSVKVVHTYRPCSSSMDDLQISMDDQNLLRPDRRIHNTWRNFKCCNSY